MGLALAMAAWLAICLAQLARFAAAARYVGGVEDAPSHPPAAPRLFLLVPVLDEQKLIDESLAWFGGLTRTHEWLSVVYVTTQRERSCGHAPTTGEMIRRRLGEFDRISLIHYPYRHGVMAHQLNYAVDRLLEEQGGELLLGIYNIDSQPTADAISRARADLLNDPASVVQQYAIYPYPEPVDFGSAVLSHVALWQTRWSLHFEMGRTLFAQALPDRGGLSGTAAELARPLLYTIGHGLFLHSRCWRQLSGFPEDEINEDAFFGLQLRLAGYRLRTIPYLESALPPPSVGIHLRQQAVWFNGPARAWHYLAKLILGSDGRHQARPRLPVRAWGYAALETFKLWLHAAYWFLGPLLILGVIPAAALWQGRPVELALWLVLALWHCWGFHLLVHRVHRRTGVATGRPGNAAAALVAYLLHGVGPILWLMNCMTGRNEQSKKHRTEKRSRSVG